MNKRIFLSILILISVLIFSTACKEDKGGGGTTCSGYSFSSEEVGDLFAVTLSNDNILIAYKTATADAKAVIVSSSGQIVTGPTVLEAGSDSGNVCGVGYCHKNISAARLGNGNIVIIFKDSESFFTTDKYVVVDENLTVVKAVTVLAADSENYAMVSASAFSDGSNRGLLHSYTDLHIIDSSGNIVSSHNNAVNQGRVFATSLSNGEICIVVGDNSSLNKGWAYFVDSSGTITGPIIIADEPVWTYSISEFGNGNILVVYDSSNIDGKGKFVIINSSGTVLTSPTQFLNYQSLAATVTLANGNVLIGHADGTCGLRLYSIINSSGTIIESSVKVNDCPETDKSSLTLLSTGTVINAYSKAEGPGVGGIGYFYTINP